MRTARSTGSSRAFRRIPARRRLPRTSIGSTPAYGRGDLRAVLTALGDEKIACLLHSASRDEREFVEPDSFIWNRSIQRVLSFGLGQHHCIGKHLAKLEVRTLVHEFLSQVNSFEVVEDEAVRNPSCFQRGWISLPVIIKD